MSVSCKHCGTGAGYGYEIGHKSDCPALKSAERIRRIHNRMMKLDPEGDEPTVIGPIDAPITPPAEIDPAIVEVAKKGVYQCGRKALMHLSDQDISAIALAALQAAAPLLVKGEREACAKIAENGEATGTYQQRQAEKGTKRRIATAIRERGKA